MTFLRRSRSSRASARTRRGPFSVESERKPSWAKISTTPPSGAKRFWKESLAGLSVRSVREAGSRSWE